MRSWIAHINEKLRAGRWKTWAACWGVLFWGLGMLSGGCASLPSFGVSEIMYDESVSTLVVPPISSNSAWQEVNKKNLRTAYFRGISSVGGINAVSPPSSEALQHALRKNNLLQNGKFSREELYAIGEITDADTVLATNVTDIRPYGPQRVAVRVLWLKTSPQEVLCDEYFELDLSRYSTRKKYISYLGHTRKAQMRETLLQTDHPGKAKLHTALFSNRKFWRFVGSSVAKELYSKM